MKIKIIAFLPLVICLALVGYFYKALYEDASLLPSALIGKPLPEFSLPSLTDSQKVLTKSDLTGDFFLLNVWATWCPSCYQEHPELVKLAKDHKVNIVGLNYRDDRLKALGYLKRYEDPYSHVLFDESGRFGIELGVYGAPETYLIDPKGTIQYRHVGVVTLEVWNTIFKPLIDTMQSESKQATL